MAQPIELELKRAEPIPEVIECLESLLAEAQSGQMRSIVYLSFGRDGDWSSGNAGERFNRHYVLGCFMGAALDYYHRRREDDTGERT